MKRGKRHMTDGMELPNQDKIRKLWGKETYKYLDNLEADTIKQMDMKRKIQKESLRRTRKLLEIKLSSRNFIKGRGLACIEDSVDASIQRLEDYIEKHERVQPSEKIPTRHTMEW